MWWVVKGMKPDGRRNSAGTDIMVWHPRQRKRDGCNANNTKNEANCGTVYEGL
jgi:hypothetical protein